jgi:nucleotide-binding universal stress UspA family protein
MTWKLILVPHDFSSSANHAVALARDEAKLRGAKIVLLHVIDIPSHYGPDAVVIPPETGAPISIKDYAAKSAQTHVDDLAARIAKDGVTATAEVRFGSAVAEILRAAEELKVDAIFMGTHGHGGVRHLIAGSVAERIVRAAKVPVMTVRHPD